MNIIHLTTYVQGGAGKMMTELAIHQAESGHHVTLVTSRTEVPGYLNYPEYIQRLMGSPVRLCQIDSTFKRDRYLNRAVVRALQPMLARTDL
ncbi:MAG: hypothetical protein JSW39_00120, partial [Desulfobacterales bacterium]